MASIEQRIQAASAQNASLLASLGEVQYAAPAQSQRITRIADLRRDITHSEAEAIRLGCIRLKEQQQYEKSSGSYFRKHASKLTGKKGQFDEQAANEERQYQEAAREEKRANEHVAELKQNLAKEIDAKEQLEGPIQLHADLQAKLDALYDSVFEHPTPEFPEQDAKKAEMESAKSHFMESLTALNTENKVIELLDAAKTTMQKALDQLSHAKTLGTVDVFAGSKSMIGILKRQALQETQQTVQEAQRLTDEATRLQKQVDPLGTVQVTQANVWTQIVFDNVFADISLLNKMSESRDRLEAAMRKLTQQAAQARARAKQMRLDLNGAREQVELSKVELQRVRSEVFETVKSSMIPPPGYVESETTYKVAAH